MQVLLRRFGKGRTAWADAAVGVYAARLPKHLAYSEELLAPGRSASDDAERLLRLHAPTDRLVVLDERGSHMSSEAFAGLLTRASAEGAKRIVFALGGPYGHDERVRKAGWQVVALSALVLNHELARVVVVEQLYRASHILWGGPYHHA